MDGTHIMTVDPQYYEHIAKAVKLFDPPGYCVIALVSEREPDIYQVFETQGWQHTALHHTKPFRWIYAVIVSNFQELNLLKLLVGSNYLDCEQITEDAEYYMQRYFDDVY